MSVDTKREAKKEMDYVEAGEILNNLIPQYEKLACGGYMFLEERSVLIGYFESYLASLDSLPTSKEIVSLQAQCYRFLRDLYLYNGDLKMQLIMSLDLMSTCFSSRDAAIVTTIINDADTSFSQAYDLVNHLKESKKSLGVPEKTITSILDFLANVAEITDVAQVGAEDILRAQLLLQSTPVDIGQPVVEMDSSSPNDISALDANAAPAAIPQPAPHSAASIANSISSGNRT